MRINRYIQILLVCLIAIMPSVVKGQETPGNNPDDLSTAVIEEKIVLTTDRTLYIAGENLQFKAVYLTDKDPGNIQWSTVLYIELITPEGSSEAKFKFPLTANGVSGRIGLPDNLPNGRYFLKAYTKWMRNYPASNYGYYPIKLINPFNATLLSTNGIAKSDERIAAEIQEADDRIRIETDKGKYKRREKVEVKVNVKNSTPQYNQYAVSVVKKGAKDLSVIQSGWSNLRSGYDQPVSYLPEIHGISMSGRILDQLNKASVEDARVYISSLNAPSFFSEMRTNPKGEFYFTFPYSEWNHDFFMNVEKDDLGLDIQIDNDFCQKAVTIGNADFNITEAEKELASEMAVNTQIAGKYRDLLNPGDSSAPNREHISFYGSPNKVFYTKDYIDLPNIEEFLFELVPEITVTYHKNIPSMRSSTPNAYQNFPYLIFIDKIPVTDLKTYLRIKTNTIEKFELVNNSYVIGDAKYNGILNTFSKDQDIAGIDLPKNSLFFNYQMYTPSASETTQIRPNSRVPDRRNCLYWNPGLLIPNRETSGFSFYTSDVKGAYEIIIHCVSEFDGSVSFSVAEFTVE